MKSECCTNENNVLKGCPMLQKEVGCFNVGPCGSNLNVIIKDGKKYLTPSKCEHHPDRFEIGGMYARKAKYAESISPTPLDNTPMPNEVQGIDFDELEE